MIWINDWNDIIRHVIFSDKELMNLMKIPEKRVSSTSSTDTSFVLGSQTKFYQMKMFVLFMAALRLLQTSTVLPAT